MSVIILEQFCVNVLIFVICFTVSIAETSDCGHSKADIVFLLDASTSEGENNFKKQLDFVGNFTKAHAIGPDGLLVGIVTFSSQPRNQFNLNRYSNKSSLLSAIQNVPYALGDTYTNEALKYVRQNSFQAANGARSGVPNILVVMTDGESTIPTATVTEAALIHKTDITVVAIGIGSRIQIKELNAIASDRQHAFTVPSFDSLQSIETEIQRVTCVTEKIETTTLPSSTSTITVTTTTTETTTTTTTVTTSTTALSTIAECAHNKADIVFLLDSSTSEGDRNFQKQLDFVGNFTKDKEIGPDNVQVGIVTFSSSPRNAFNLNTYSDKTSLTQGIHTVKYMSGDTYTNLALKYVRENSFLTSHGARSGVPKILVVMTDGESTIPRETVTESALLHKTDVKVVAIGIGSRVQITELNTIASDSQLAFTVPSFDSLRSIEKEIQRATCFTSKVGQPTPAAIVECVHNKADIVFLLDSSTSEGEDNFRKQLDFVVNFTKGYDIGPDAVQVGIVTFSNQPHNVFYLNKFTDKVSLIHGIQNTHYLRGDTYTDEALKFVRENSFLPVHGSRYGVPKILVVMTDGESTRPTATVTEAKTLHYTDIKVISIGIGNRVNPTELDTIATDHEHAFTVPSFDSLQTIEHEIQAVTCVSEKLVTCDNKSADIVFVLHASTKDIYKTELDFVRNVTQALNVGPGTFQVSLVTVGSQVYNEFFLNTYSDKSDIISAELNASYISGNANTPVALKFVRENSFRPENGGRGNSVTKLAVIITDEDSNLLYTTKTEATNLHHSGVKVISVGIGSSVSRAELDNIASDLRHVFSVTDSTRLGSLQQDIENVACTTTSGCGDKPTDIVFILDCSANEGRDNFHKELDFMSEFVKQFDIGPSDVQVSLITAGSSARTEFYLNEHKDKASLISAIQSARYWGGGTDVYDGIRYAHYYHFSTNHGARPNANRLVIVLTEGNSRDPTRTTQEGQLLKNTGAKIITISIGSKVNEYELTNIATDRNHALSVGSFDILHTVLPEVTEESCEGTKPLPVPMKDCGHEQADIVFILDSSSSEGRIHFQAQLDFVRDFVYQFSIGPNAIQVSVVVFSTYVKEEFSLNKYQDQAAVLSAISKIPFVSGASSTDKALSFVRTDSFLAKKGARQNASDIVILLTDGRSGSPQDTRREAVLLKSLPNTKVIAIGIGSAVDTNELRTIASNNESAITLTDFNALSTLRPQLTYIACQTCDFLSKADVVFAIGISNESALNFHKVLDFVSTIVNDLQIGVHKVLVGVFTFSGTPTKEINLNQYTSKASLLSGIQKIAYNGNGDKNISEMLEFAHDNMFPISHDDRAAVQKYLIMITDGFVANTAVTTQKADLIKKNTNVIAVGIGSNIKTTELSNVASDKDHVLKVNTFDDLHKLRHDVKMASCEEGALIVSPTAGSSTVLPSPKAQ